MNDRIEAIRPGSPFQPYEVAFRIPGQSWKRRTIKNRTAESKFYDMVNEEDAEVRWSDDA